MKIISIICLLLFNLNLFAAQQATKSEIQWLEKTIHVKGDQTMIYVIVTNRTYNETHGNTTSPSPQPQNSTKRFVEQTPMPAPQAPAIPPVSPPIYAPTDLWLKSIFIPSVDTLSILRIANLTWSNITTVYDSWRSYYPDLRVYLQFNNGTNVVKSSRKRFWSVSTVIGSWSAMVRLYKGKVVAIEWDDGCEECDANHCLDNVCALDQTSCKGTNCDMKIYLAWIGTDYNDRYCTSAGSLPSNFRTFSFGTMYDQAAKAIYNPALTIFDANKN
jgi:hypothetical protein